MIKENTKHKILVVDDDGEVAKCFSDFMGLDFRIEHFFSGIDALQRLKRAEDIDIVLLDDRLPDISGIEVLKRIKATKPHVPVVLMVACGSEELAIKAFRNGAKDYMQKPLNFFELKKMILTYLSFNRAATDDKKREVIYHDNESPNDFNRFEVNSRYSYNIQKALKFIDDNHGNKIKLQIVANYAGMSECHFSKIFRKLLGVTYQNYLSCIRIKTAMELLKKQKYSITEVAFEVGYGDITHFGKIFKKIAGCPPSQYCKIIIAEQKNNNLSHD